MKKKIIQIEIALILFLIALVVPFENKIINNIFYIISYVILGAEIVKEAIENIFKGEIFDENFLMTIATIGAFAIGEFPEAVAVMLFYQIGETFQHYAVDKSKKSIADLMNIRPDYANVNINGKTEKISPNEVKIGEEIIVKPGEKIPLDGVIIEGNSMIDTSSLTGESIPRVVKTGDEVLSGCINQNGLLKIKVKKEFGESTVSRILDLVENASNKKSKAENFITKFAKYYTPIVVIIAVGLAFIPPFILGIGDFTEWLYRALSFLVVSCPCALVISIPLSFFGGIGGASKIGILIKGGNYLEALAQTETVVFDKTGTLTEGIFEVQQVNSKELKKEELLKIAAYSENYSNHPISNSLKKAYGKDIDNSLIKSTQEISGHGVIAIIGEKQVFVGNEKLMQEKNIKYEKCNEIGTVIYVAIDNKYAGNIVIADKIKEDSKNAIQSLNKNKIKEIVMLTGDKKEVGGSVAKALGIKKVHTELLPDEKVKIVEKLIEKKGKVAFIGDGINDAPVLAMADVGIAMGALGADAAIEAADIIIMTDEPSKIGDSIKIAKKTMKIVKQNIIFAIGVKVVVLVLSAFGLSTMWEAVFADVGVSVLAVLNSLRMLKV